MDSFLPNWWQSDSLPGRAAMPTDGPINGIGTSGGIIAAAAVGRGIPFRRNRRPPLASIQIVRIRSIFFSKLKIVIIR